MKKRTLIVGGIILVAAIIFGVGELGGLFPWQYISESQVKAFIDDSHYAFVYNLPDASTRDEYDSILTSDLETNISAATYAARKNFNLDVEGDGYIIPSDQLVPEKANLFFDDLEGSFNENELLTTNGDNYLLHLKDVDDSNLTYEITDSFYGLIGSESTYITVTYKLNDKECKIEYSLVDDKNSPYKFKVSDVRVVYDYDNLDITGIWMSEHDLDKTDDYYALTFESDGTGNITNMKEWLGVPFTYEVDANYIDTHMGSADDYTPMTYDGFDDTINYNDVKYTRVDENIAQLVGKWDAPTNEDGEYLELIVEPDCSGYVLHMPLNIGLPLRFAVNDDGSFTVEEGSPEFTSTMTYDAKNDVITYDDVTYTRAD